jgi:hypothetical protein
VQVREIWKSQGKMKTLFQTLESQGKMNFCQWSGNSQGKMDFGYQNIKRTQNKIIQ